MQQIRKSMVLAKRLFAGAALSAVMAVAPGYTQETIKVGMLMTHVGGTGLFAREQARAAELYIEEVNNSGGIDGRTIELISYDTEGKADRAGNLFRRLADDDGVVAVIGPDSAYITLVIQDVPTNVGVMSVAGPGLYEMVKSENRGYLVSAWSAYAFAGSLAIAYHKDEFGAKNVGMITTADGIGERIASTVQKIGEKIGVNVIVASQPGSDRDLLPSLRRLASANPPIDALYVFGSGPFGNIAMNQSELAGIEVPIFYTGGNIIPALVKNLSPEAAARVFFTTARGGVAVDTLPADDPYVEAISKFANAFEAKFGEGVTFPATVGYDMAHTVIDAIRNVGTDRDAIATYITEKQRISGMQGVEFERVAGEGYGIHPSELIIATIKDGGFAFKAYLSDSLENVGLTKDVLDELMRDEQILPN